MDYWTEEEISLPGRLYTGRAKDCLVHNLFMCTPAVNPWDTLLTHSTTSLITRTLLLSWNSLQDEACNTSVDDDAGEDKLRLLHPPIGARDLQSNSLCTQFLTALPDVIGILIDHIILEAFNKHLVIHSHAKIPLLHRLTSSGDTVIRQLLTNI